MDKKEGNEDLSFPFHRFSIHLGVQFNSTSTIHCTTKPLRIVIRGAWGEVGETKGHCFMGTRESGIRY